MVPYVLDDFSKKVFDCPAKLTIDWKISVLTVRITNMLSQVEQTNTENALIRKRLCIGDYSCQLNIDPSTNSTQMSFVQISRQNIWRSQSV